MVTSLFSLFKKCVHIRFTQAKGICKNKIESFPNFNLCVDSKISIKNTNFIEFLVSKIPHDYNINTNIKTAKALKEKDFYLFNNDIYTALLPLNFKMTTSQGLRYAYKDY